MSELAESPEDARRRALRHQDAQLARDSKDAWSDPNRRDEAKAIDLERGNIRDQLKH